MTREQLQQHVAETVELCSNRIREALELNRLNEATDAASALRDCTSALRDLEDDDG